MPLFDTLRANLVKFSKISENTKANSNRLSILFNNHARACIVYMGLLKTRLIIMLVKNKVSYENAGKIAKIVIIFS